MAATSNDETRNVLWRTIFMAIILAIVTMVISISIFFYIRSREAVWDNRSGTSRLIAINRNSTIDLGLESFTMFGTENISLNGETITDNNTIYIADGGIILLEVTGMSRGETTTSVDSYKSRILINRKGVNTITPLDITAVDINPTTIDIYPINGSGGTIRVTLSSSRVEFKGQWNLVEDAVRSHAIKIDVVGWYP